MTVFWRICPESRSASPGAAVPRKRRSHCGLLSRRPSQLHGSPPTPRNGESLRPRGLSERPATQHCPPCRQQDGSSTVQGDQLRRRLAACRRVRRGVCRDVGIGRQAERGPRLHGSHRLSTFDTAIQSARALRSGFSQHATAQARLVGSVRRPARSPSRSTFQSHSGKRTCALTGRHSSLINF